MSKSTQSTQVGGVRTVSSTSTTGGSREEPRAASGNWDAEQYRRDAHAEWSQRFQEQGGFGGFGMFGFGGFNPGAMEMFGELGQIEERAQEIEAETQVEQTHLSDLDPELLANLEPDTILRFAFSPEDMQALDLNGEHDAIAEVRSVLTVNNPTPELMEHLISSGQFEDVVWSGHGSEKGLWITNADGQAELMESTQIADMFKDSSVQEILLNVCNGGKEVDQMLNAVGVDTFAYDREIDDQEAMEDAVAFAENGSLEDIGTENRFRMGEGSNFWEQITNMQVRSGGRHGRGHDPAAFAAAMAAISGMFGGQFGVFGGMAAGKVASMAQGGAPKEASVVQQQGYGGEGDVYQGGAQGGLAGVAGYLGTSGNTYGGEGGYVDPYSYRGYGFDYSGQHMIR